MKRSNQRLWHILGCIALAHLTACSFGGGQEEPTSEVAAVEGDASNVAEAPAAPEGAETALPNPSDAAAEATANVADPTAGGDPAASEIPPELLGSIPSPTEGVPGAEGSAMAEGGLPPSPEAGSMASPDLAGTASPDPASTASPSPAPSDAIPMAAPMGDTRVYYVSAAGVSMKDKPDAAGQSVGQLMQGDPVLVKIEGTWANVVNRGWVEVASLSMSPVGRSKPTKSWN